MNPEWHLVPWTLQYIAGGVAVFIISLVVYLTASKKSWAYRSFLLFGVTTAAWNVFAFLHRNAPSPEVSALYFRLDLLFVGVSWSFLPIMLLFIIRERYSYFWISLPGAVLSVWGLLSGPFEIIESYYGWSFKFEPLYGKAFYATSMIYLLTTAIAFAILIRRTKNFRYRIKYIIVTASYFTIYGVSMILITLVLQNNPKFPPFGGIISLLQFSVSPTP